MPRTRRAILGIFVIAALGAWAARALRSTPANVGLELGVTYRDGLKLDLARPRGPGLHPAVLCVHGGGWVQGGREQYRWLLEELARRGFVGVSLDYRLAPAHTFPAAVDDVRAGLRWTVDHAAELGVDASRVALVGDSAGGHLATLVATTTAGVRAVVSFYGVYDLTVPPPSELARQFATQFLGRADPELASPIRQAGSGVPPMLLVHGMADDLVPVEQAERFAARLEQVGGRVETLLIPGAGHAFTGEPARQAWERAERFLDQELKPNAPP